VGGRGRGKGGGGGGGGGGGAIKVPGLLGWLLVLVLVLETPGLLSAVWNAALPATPRPVEIGHARCQGNLNGILLITMDPQKGPKVLLRANGKGLANKRKIS
jgi:hypothetical protein